MASELTEGIGALTPEEPGPEDQAASDQTEHVLWSFMRHRFTLDQLNDDSRLDVASPVVHELSSEASVGEATTAVIGRQLAQMGNEFDALYGSKLKHLSRSLRITKDMAYESFVCICRKIFADGVVNLGRIAVLLQFGYHMAIEYIQQGLPDFLRQIVSYLVRFIVTEKVSNTVRSIASWIAEQGGWVAAASQGLGRLGATSAHLSLIMALCVTTISIVALFKR